MEIEQVLSFLKGVRKNGVGWSSLCPAHDDHRPSLSIDVGNDGRTLLCCHTGCKVEEITLALGLSPSDLFPSDNGHASQILNDRKQNPPKNKLLPKSEIEKARVWYAHLRDDFERLTKELPWTKEAVKKAGVGYDPDTGRFIYIHRDHQGLVLNVKHGKGRGGQAPYNIESHGKNRLYPGHMLSEYDPESIILAEGEPDTVALISQGFQAVTGTAGAGSVPVDLSALSRFEKIYICFDHDKAGRDGAIKWAEALNRQGPDSEIYISQWSESEDKGFDATDFFTRGQSITDFKVLMLDGAKRFIPTVEKPAEIHLREPVIVRMSDVEPQEVSWLWYPYIPHGKLTLLEGDPGVGKTFLALQLAAIISQGHPFPGLDGVPSGERRKPATVMYMSAEDGPADTLRPRLDAAEADPSRVFILEEWREQTENGERTGMVTLQDVSVIEQALTEYRPQMLVVDPLQAYFGSNVDIHRANETRPVLAALGKLAERHGTAILCIRHLTKSTQANAIYRGLGSIDFAAAARSILLVAADKDNPVSRVVAHVKSSLAETGQSVGFELTEGRFRWTGKSDLTVDELLAPKGTGESGSAMEEAKGFLLEALSNGPRPTLEILSEARQLGLSDRSIRRAREALQVKPQRSGGIGSEGHWTWGFSY